MGNEPVAPLLERSMADKMHFAERTREMLREICGRALGALVKERAQERAAA